MQAEQPWPGEDAGSAAAVLSSPSAARCQHLLLCVPPWWTVHQSDMYTRTCGRMPVVLPAALENFPLKLNGSKKLTVPQ